MKKLVLWAGCLGIAIAARTQTNSVAFATTLSPFASESGIVKAPVKTSLQNLVSSRTQGRAILGFSKGKQPVELFYYPGGSKEKILIIGGVHGSELSAIRLALLLGKKLETADLKNDVLLIPCLFPDNAEKARMAKNKTSEGRYSCKEGIDPNRQMPGIGEAFNLDLPKDAQGRMIEKENQMLLQLIQEYKPRLIINLHAIRNVNQAGFYADPRTDCKGIALGFEQDSLLAIQMSTMARGAGGSVLGNHLDSIPTALYYKDPCIAAAGQLQKRNTEGSLLNGGRGKGVSLGTWATTAVCRGQSGGFRAAIPLITVEFPGYQIESGHSTFEINLQAYATGILSALVSFTKANELTPAATVYIR
jgi:hypothetical protein